MSGAFTRASSLRWEARKKLFFYEKTDFYGVRKFAPGKKTPQKNAPQKFALQEIPSPPRNIPRENNPLRKLPPGKKPSTKNAPPEKIPTPLKKPKKRVMFIHGGTYILQCTCLFNLLLSEEKNL